MDYTEEEYFNITARFVHCARELQKVGKLLNIKNVSQPGTIKEGVLVDLFKHKLHITKHEHDAEDFPKSHVNSCDRKRYEYFTSLQKYSSFDVTRANNNTFPTRMLKNDLIICALFDDEDVTKVLEYYHVLPEVFLEEALKQINRSNTYNITVSIPLKWVKENSIEGIEAGKIKASKTHQQDLEDFI